MATKPGWKTSEFLLTAAAAAVALLMASGVFATESPVTKGLALIASALATAGYTYGRSLLKAKAP